MRNGNFYLTTIICVIILMLPVLSYRFYLLDVHPSLSDKVRYKRKMAQIKSRQSNDTLRTPSARRARRSLRSGYAFAHQVESIQMYVAFSPLFMSKFQFQEGFGRLITSGKIMRKLPQDFAFPLGLGSKRQLSTDGQTSSNKLTVNNNTAAVAPSPDDGVNTRAPYQDLDTINL